MLSVSKDANFVTRYIFGIFSNSLPSSTVEETEIVFRLSK